MKILRITLIALTILLFYAAAAALAKQTQPDAKRVKQIQTALVQHGYPTGKSWPETQEILRGIAKEHHWQTHFAPDARAKWEAVIMKSGTEQGAKDWDAALARCEEKCKP